MSIINQFSLLTIGYLYSMSTNCYSGVYDGFLPDKRLEKRLELIMEGLIKSGTSVVNKTTRNLSCKTATYRALMNPRFDYTDILDASYAKCAKNIDTDHVLCIQDTTEFNLSGIADKIGKDDVDVGPTTNKKIAGIFCHPMLICSATESKFYGLAAAEVYNRTWGQKDKFERDYGNLPIQEKESYRWITTPQKTKETIGADTLLTIIGDRESDIFEEFATVPDKQTHLLVRCKTNRRLIGSEHKLYEQLQQQQKAATAHVELKGNNKRQKRTAEIEVRFCQVSIKAPTRYKGDVEQIELYAIEAKEVTKNLPTGVTPLVWRLLTTHKVNDSIDAIKCIDWYKQRWNIEELFRVIKSKGFRIENNQLSKGASIKKLICLTLEAAVYTMQLKAALNPQIIIQPATIVFTTTQIVFMKLLLKTVEGSTEKQKNPYKEDTLAWASWIIARLGYWSGYKTHGPPGYITIKNGLNIFQTQFEIFELINQQKDV